MALLKSKAAKLSAQADATRILVNMGKTLALAQEAQVNN